jgi:hypothetical protein
MSTELRASIRVHPKTRDMLRDQKAGGETYDSVIIGLYHDSQELMRARAYGELDTGNTKGMIMFRHMLKKLIDDWLPTTQANQDFIRRFYHLLGEEAPGWLGDLTPDEWFTRWMRETYLDAKQEAEDRLEAR